MSHQQQQFALARAAAHQAGRKLFCGRMSRYGLAGLQTTAAHRKIYSSAKMSIRALGLKPEHFNHPHRLRTHFNNIVRALEAANGLTTP